MKRKNLIRSIGAHFIVILVTGLSLGAGCDYNGGNGEGRPATSLVNGSLTTGCGLVTCASAGATCGLIGDGCGGVIDCGGCTAPQTCGGGGTWFQCGGTAACVPLTQAQACTAHSANCGMVSDGCGGTISCGSCAAGQTCGGGGTAFQCGSGAGTCTPLTCAMEHASCGIMGDGCGGVLSCGTCTAPETCGGGGTLFQCGKPSACVPIAPGMACSAIGATCGLAPDGCGGTVNCGTCTAPETCGGDGIPFKCGSTGESCPKITCAMAGATCGTIGDGCGGTLNCGSCTAPQTCGGGGIASQCGAPMCTPRTCADAGATCGFVGDGCGGIINYGGGAGPGCGSCTAPAICGGSGVPNSCGAGGPDGGTCTNLCLHQTQCDAGTTTITGTVTVPGHDDTATWGTPDPIPGALVYVPNSPVLPFPSGVSCDRCDASVTGSPLVSDTSATDGSFTLTNVPCGVDVPVVIQLGRWRRQITVPAVKCCATTTLSNAQTHLPRTHTATDNIPAIAVVTGSADPMECVLPKIGIDASEFTDPTGTGRVNLYQASSLGGGATISASTPKDTVLWGNLATMKKYDLIIIDCEGSNYDKSAYYANLLAYTAAGGRIYVSHYGFAFLHGQNQTAPPALNTAWDATAKWDVMQLSPPDQVATIDQSFPKGKKFASWVQGVVGGVLGQISVANIRNDFDSVVAPSQQWIYGTNPTTFPMHYTFNTPVGASPDSQCGRVMYSDFHVNTGGAGTGTYPDECSLTTFAKLSPQEKVLEYMLFDLSSCVAPDVPTCTPKSCSDQGYNCGKQGDGCGKVIDCGTCPSSQICGGGGKPGVCGAPTCTPTTCAKLGYNCGVTSDGCGGTLNCGTCSAPDTCGGGGTDGVCGHRVCTPSTCISLKIQCGKSDDGCGGTLDCGHCAAGQTCGGGGVAGICGAPSCTPTTCAKLGYNCGAAGDGCGGILSCGTCSPSQTCGAEGHPGVCGDGPCTPIDCIALKLQCGQSDDGCGGMLSCGTCAEGQICGGGGMPGVCDTPTCKPRTCATMGAECGVIGDGCGKTISCGGCATGKSCGGGGVANKCG